MAQRTPEEAYAEAERRIARVGLGLGEYLNLGRLGLERIPDSIEKQTGLKDLILDDNRLTALPEAIGKLTQLRNLSAIGNQLSALPESIGNLTSLQYLDLSNNQLSSLPEGIGDLTALRGLDLSLNALTTIPEAVTRLPRLWELHLARNRIETVPDSVGKLTTLTKLVLDGNRLTGLPDAIGRLKALRILNLRHNQLVSLPDGLGRLTELEWLLLGSNQFTSLPRTLRNLRGLRYIGLHHNPGLGLPPEIVGNSRNPETTIDVGEAADLNSSRARALLDYYFDTQTNGRRLNEVKLILVGRGEVGKTSLVRRLVSNTFDPREEQTPGIRITHWKHDLPGYGEVQLNVWDFGGQEIMHGTHQFFLTERSLYLVVLAGRAGKEHEEAEYWLRFVHQFGNAAPTIVVLNKSRQLPFDLNRKALREKYPFVVGFVETDCHGGADSKANPAPSGFGIAALREAIEAQLSGWEALQYRFPGKWFAVKDALSGMAEDYISFDQYRTICQTHHEPDPGRQEHLAKYLNQLGIALNFKDDPRLRDTHVLKPNWLTNGVYTLLNHKPLAENRGVFRFSDLAAILPADKYPPEMHPFLLDLMRKFDLCFRLEDVGKKDPGGPEYAPDDEFLLPERLPVNEPDLGERFDPEKCLGFEYRYPTWPEGLVPRFIVRTYVLSEGKERWRSGVVLEFEGCEALVKGDETDRTVTLRIAGPADARRNALAVARTYFEEIHRAMGVEPGEFVSHPLQPGLKVSYRDLTVYEETDVPAFPVVWDNRVVTITVDEMLNSADPPGTRLAEDRPERARVFVSYAHRDERYMEQLKAHLKLAERQQLISVWYDRLLKPGDEWDPRILEELDRAHIIVMLVSASFFASGYIFEKELPRALERHRAGEALSIAVILNHCEWRTTDVSQIQLLPKDGKPVVEWKPRDKAWTQVAAAVRAAAEKV